MGRQTAAAAVVQGIPPLSPGSRGSSRTLGGRRLGCWACGGGSILSSGEIEVPGPDLQVLPGLPLEPMVGAVEVPRQRHPGVQSGINHACSKTTSS